MPEVATWICGSASQFATSGGNLCGQGWKITEAAIKLQCKAGLWKSLLAPQSQKRRPAQIAVMTRSANGQHRLTWPYIRSAIRGRNGNHCSLYICFIKQKQMTAYKAHHVLCPFGSGPHFSNRQGWHVTNQCRSNLFNILISHDTTVTRTDQSFPENLHNQRGVCVFNRSWAQLLTYG